MLDKRKYNDEVALKKRKSDFEINPLFLKRWSPRAFSDKRITKDELMLLFEAARWAPSSYNNQPWRFIYALKNTKEWEQLFSLLVDDNKLWATNASALLLIVSNTKFEFNAEHSRTHSFDCGAAWMSLALEASEQGMIAHGMQGFDYDKAKEQLNIPDDFDVEAMVAIGYPGETKSLPSKLQEKESPSLRKPLKEIIFCGKFS